ncbi:MAG: glycosyltransferase family 2 protein [Thermodesulforhabdaceae bacterium]
MTIHMHKPILSVIVVSWNTRDITEKCLESLLSQPTSVPFQVYLVDNASSDGSQEMVRQRFPQVILIVNEENVGFARANNQVLRIIDTPYALLLNSDTIIPEEDIFSPWISFMEKHKDVGMSGCRLVFPDFSQQVGDAGYRPSLRSLICHNLFLSRLFPSLAKGLFLTNYPEQAEHIDVDWVSGAAMMVKTDAARSVGLMDENVFMFAEDIEWGCRFRNNGWRVVYLPRITIIHLQGASSSKQLKPHEFSLLWLKNIKKLYVHLNPSVPPWTFNLIMVLGLLLRAQIYGWGGLILNSKDMILKGKRMIHYVAGLLS